jgi:6-pyruvoyl-tetrahydropterin synthase
VTVSADKLDAIGVVMDFHELERLLDRIILPLHNTHLNEVEPFKSELNPTTEHVAFHIARNLQLPPAVRVKSVEVWETAANSAIYRPG